MTIWYNVPPISEITKPGRAGPTIAQKGGTCWYYASKMLLKFHGRFDRKDPGLERLHQLRKLQTSLHATPTRSRRDVLSMLQQPEKVAALDEKARHAFAALNEAQRRALIEMLEKKVAERMQCYDFMSSTMPDAKFFWLTRPPTPKDLEAMLREFGPIYASGRLSKMSGHPRRAMETPAGKLAVEAVHDLSADGQHAVVIAGVHATGQIWYKDPNYSDAFQRIAFDKFIADPKLQFVTIRCNANGGGCVHTTERLIISMRD